MNEEQATGLLHKYDVKRVNDPDGKHDGCRYFVLDPQHDPLARDALASYAKAAHYAGYEALAQALNQWLSTACRYCGATEGLTNGVCDRCHIEADGSQ